MDDLDAIIQANKSCDEMKAFFTAPAGTGNMADKFMADLEEEIQAGPLDHASLSPELCAELAQAKEQAKFWAAREKSLVEQAKRLAGKHRGLLPIGTEWALEITEKKGRTSVDFEQYVTDMMGKDGLAEAREKYSKQGEPTVSLSIKRMGAQK